MINVFNFKPTKICYSGFTLTFESLLFYIYKSYIKNKIVQNMYIHKNVLNDKYLFYK